MECVGNVEKLPKESILGLEKLTGHKTIVMTGRNEDIEFVANRIVEYPHSNILFLPDHLLYFQDYPKDIDELREELDVLDEVVVIATQSKEYLDCLLESKLDFILATVRREDDEYHLRVMSKSDALYMREMFDMELRV